MSSDIKPGDLVMVVKPTPCCGNAKRIGQVFKAGRFGDLPGRCQCGFWMPRPVGILHPEDGIFILVSRLIKINPPGVDQNVERPEEVAA